MHTRRTISIIGAAGNMGTAISISLVNGNYRLLLCGRDFDKLQKLEQEIKSHSSTADVEALNCMKESGWEADIIIMAVPYPQEKDIALRIKEVANQKIVISISNPLNEQFDGLLTPSESSAAESLQALLPHSKIVKAFNTNFASTFYEPVMNDHQIDSFIAGDDEESVQEVATLVAATGFRPLIAGKLSASRILESMQLLLIQLGQKYNYNWRAGWKILH